MSLPLTCNSKSFNQRHETYCPSQVSHPGVDGSGNPTLGPIGLAGHVQGVINNLVIRQAPNEPNQQPLNIVLDLKESVVLWGLTGGNDSCKRQTAALHPDEFAADVAVP